MVFRLLEDGGGWLRCWVAWLMAYTATDVSMLKVVTKMDDPCQGARVKHSGWLGDP